MADKLQRIQQLMANVPVLNEEANARLKAAQQLQLQQLAKSTPTAQGGVRAAQAAAPVATQQLGQAQLQQQQQAAQTSAALAEQGLKEQAQTAQSELAAQELGQKVAQSTQELSQNVALAAEEEASKNRLSTQEIAVNKRLSDMGIDVDNNISFLSNKQRQDLSRLGVDVKQKIFDARLQFDRDEAGRKFSNERQLEDWTIATAKSQQELQQKLQLMEQVNQRELLVLEAANAKIAQALENGYLDNKRKLDQASMIKLAEMKQKMERDIQKKQAKAANQRLIVGGLITGAGAAMMATPAAAAAPVVMGMGAAYAAGGQ